MALSRILFWPLFLCFVLFVAIRAEKPKVLVTHPQVPKEALDLLSKTMEVIVVESFPPKREEILEKCRGVDALLWATHDPPLNAEILDIVGPQLKVVTTMSAGFDTIDVKELKKRNIALGHTPRVLSDAVADIAVGLMLAAARRFHEGRQKIESNNWESSNLNWLFGQDIRGATVGFYGFGNIGQAIAKRLLGFDIEKILYTTRNRIDEEIEKKLNAQKVDFSTMLTQSDIIFTGVPLTAETRGVFNATAFDKMKKSAVFVNTSRGKIVNQADLYEALKTGSIFAAGLDVVDPEPLATDDPILTLPNVVITPHIGSATCRTRTDMAYLAANNILSGLTGARLPAAVY